MTEDKTTAPPEVRPGVSAIIPCFRSQASIGQALASIAAQTLRPHEIVVVDDGSPEPLSLADTINGIPVHLIRHAVNAGAGAARNTGARNARFGLLAFLDADDAWAPQKLAQQLAAWSAQEPENLAPRASATGFALTKGVGANRRTRRLLPSAAETPEAFTRGCWFCPGSTLMIGRAEFLALGGFDERLRRLEDYDFFLRFGFAGGRLDVVAEVLADIHVERHGRALANVASGEIIRQKFLAASGSLDPGLRHTILAYLMLENAANARRNGAWIEFAGYIARSWLAVPRLRLHLGRFWTEG